MEALRGHFAPEFLNRLDKIALFQPLAKAHLGGAPDACARLYLDAMRIPMTLAWF